MLAAGLALSACAGTTAKEAGGASTTLNIVGFAVPEAANKAIAAEWNKTPAGKGVKFQTSYGASGDQSRAVVAGLKADYVHFSVSSDVTRLVDAKLVDPSWNQGPTKGIVSSSVVVLAVRPGNPKGIKGWDDLIEPGVEIVTPNPASSGAARWNALAAYGQVIEGGGAGSRVGRQGNTGR
jgi:sulfate transport system substrate-binding protein